MDKAIGPTFICRDNAGFTGNPPYSIPPFSFGSCKTPRPHTCIAQARKGLGKRVDEADTTREMIRITRHGRTAAVLMSADDLDSLHETLHALRTPGLIDDLAQADADYAAGNTVSGEELRRRYGLS